MKQDQGRPDQTNIKFPDNRLWLICGEFDKNLAEIEQKLLQIVRRGNELNLLATKFQDPLVKWF